jgi:hypothetical protein
VTQSYQRLLLWLLIVLLLIKQWILSWRGQ